MQIGKLRIQEVSNSKLLVIITTALIALLAIPVIIPHITHTGLIYHILLHIASVIIAVFLTAVSIIAYRRNGGSRLLFMTSGFAVLAFVEFLYLFYAAVNIEGSDNSNSRYRSLTYYSFSDANLVWHRSPEGE